MAFIIEHKTTSASLDQDGLYFRRLALDSQVSAYVSAAALAGIDVEGVIYDVIKKPLLKPKKGETPAQFEERICYDILEHPDAYYVRSVVKRAPQQLANDDANSLAYLRQIQAMEKAGFFPQNPDSCADYFSACDYLDVCRGEVPIESVPKKDEPRRSLTIVSNSSLSCFRTCPRKFQYKYVDLRRPKDDGSFALRFGKLMHSALEAWWTTADLPASLATIPADLDPFDRARITALMMGYHARWRAEPWATTHVEVPFEVPIGGTEFVRIGQIDAIAEYQGAA